MTCNCNVQWYIDIATSPSCDFKMSSVQAGKASPDDTCLSLSNPSLTYVPKQAMFVTSEKSVHVSMCSTGKMDTRSSERMHMLKLV